MPKPSLHARLPLNWPVTEPTPFDSDPGGLRAIRAALGRDPGQALVPHGNLDPVHILSLPYLTNRGRLALLDRLFRAADPGDPQVIDRFIDAYLLLAYRGFAQVPGISPRRRALAQTTLRAVELMNRLFRDTWHRQMAPPAGWWRRFLETFRAAGEARLFAIRRPRFLDRGETTPLFAAGETFLEAAANPFAWEPELRGHLHRLLGLFSSDVLLFPAASPSAYAQGQRGRFVFDVADDHGPATPESWEGHTAPTARPDWWILDTSRVLARLADFRRNLALGVPPARVHEVLAEIPESSRAILLRRMEGILARPERRTRHRDSGQAHMVIGLEQTVRHRFARRWTGTRDLTILDTNVRLQSEVGTRDQERTALRRWQVLDHNAQGMRLRGPIVPGSSVTGRVAGVLESDAGGSPADSAFQAGLVRWQRIDAGGNRTEIGLELLPGPPEDCWLRMMRGPGSILHEYPGLLLAPESETGTSLLVAAGLFQAGGLLTLRRDDRDHTAEMVRILEFGVHFERIEIRLDRSS